MNADRVDAELALLVDAGAAWAKASAIGRVRGRWRVVARVAQPTAWGPAELRRSLVERIAAVADARLAARAEDLVDGANRIECHSAVRPGRLAVVAVSRELSGLAARRAAEAAGWDVVELASLDDGRSLADRLARLQALDVDAWVIAGGFEAARSPRAMEAAALVASARRPGAGAVVWAGSSRLAGEVVPLFEPGGATAVANPRPDHRREEPGPLREHLRTLLRETTSGDRASSLTATALPRSAAALAATTGLRVLLVDVGARGALRALAGPDGTVSSTIRARGGLAGLASVAGAGARVARLTPGGTDEADVADLLQTLRTRPATIPHTAEELALVQTAARLQLASLIEDDPPGPVDLLVGCGSTIAAAPHPAQAMRILLDGVRPLGVTQLAVDPAAVLGPLGSLPDAEIREGMSLLTDDLVAPLGTAVVTRGGEPGRPAMRVTVHRAGWPESSPVEVRVGQLLVVPLARGLEAELTIELGDGVTLGAPRRSPRIHVAATGGAVGLVLDARGIPIPLPRRGDDRRAVLVGWRDALQREAGRTHEGLS